MTIFWMLPERFRIDVNADESTVVRTVHVHPHLFERLGTYQDPLFEENWDVLMVCFVLRGAIPRAGEAASCLF
jgi:hypothetical protein